MEKNGGKIGKFEKYNVKVRWRNLKILMQKRVGEIGKFGKSEGK